jgi:hypothetical protein
MSHSTQRTLPLSLDGRTATLPRGPSRQAIVELLAQLHFTHSLAASVISDWGYSNRRSEWGPDTGRYGHTCT